MQENRGTSRILIPSLFYLPDCAIPLGRARGRVWGLGSSGVESHWPDMTLETVQSLVSSFSPGVF